MRTRILLAVPALVAALTAGGCASGTGGPLGGVLGGILNPAGSNTISGTVSGLDTRNRVVYVNTDNGQQVPVRYDDQTQVVYQNQNYAVGNLERGDSITVQLQGTGNGQYYTSYIQVNQSVQNSGSSYPGGYDNNYNYTTLSGRVSQINYQDGTFLLQQQNAPSLIVQMPYNPRQNDVQVFNALRNGQYVRIQGQYIAQGRFQLAAFM